MVRQTVGRVGEDRIPGMAEAIERRATERGLTPSSFAAAANLTGPGLDPVRNGVRKQYAAKTRIGVARALRWPVDWYERILNDEDPATFPDTEHPDSAEDRLSSVEGAVAEIRAELSQVVERLAQVAQQLERIAPPPP